MINLHTIRPLYRELIVTLMKKTLRIVTVEKGWPKQAVGSDISALMMESTTFDFLDAPMQRVTGFDVLTPYTFNIEKLAFLT